MKSNKCNIKMTLVSKGINIEKICKNEFEVYQFERDMPAKYNLLFSNIPYAIGKINLNYLTSKS